MDYTDVNFNDYLKTRNDVDSSDGEEKKGGNDDLKVSFVGKDDVPSPKGKKTRKPRTVRHIKIQQLDTDTISPKEPGDYNSSKIVVIGKSGSGKCLAYDTDVMLHNGKIIKVQDIQIGDLLMGDDSTARTVISLGRGRAEMFRITTTKGDSYTVNGDHILCLRYNANFDIRYRSDRKCWALHWIDRITLKERYKHFQTENDAENFRDSLKQGWDGIYEIPVYKYLGLSQTVRRSLNTYKTSLEFDYKEPQVDPYIIGYWLGDGTSDSPHITTQESSVLHYFRNWANKNNMFLDIRDRYTYRLKNCGPGISNFRVMLNGLNLIKNKHIPECYKYNNRDVRLKILAGLLDSDGYYNNGCYDFIQKNEMLIDDVVFLCNSLGFAAYKKLSKKGCWYKGEYKEGTYYRISISGEGLENIPVLCPRKKASLRKQIKSVLDIGFKIESVGEDNYYGFEIDGNGRFVLGNFIVTHNTTIIKSLIYEKSHIIPIGVVFSGTEDSNHFWKSVFPDTFVFNGLQMDKLEAFVRRQRISKQYLKNPWAVILLDDVMDDPKMLNRPFFHGMYKNGRHWNMMYLLSSQYAMDIRPAIRTNIDCTFILRDANFRTRRCIWENYASVIPEFRDFCQIMDQVTTDYTALVILNNIQSNNWQECVFWYKAQPVPNDWKFGCKEFWEFHNDRYNNDYVDIL